MTLITRRCSHGYPMYNVTGFNVDLVDVNMTVLRVRKLFVGIVQVLRLPAESAVHLAN